MTRLLRTLFAASMLAALLASGCARRDAATITLTGTVVDDAIALSAPQIPQPEPDIQADSSQEETPVAFAPDDGAAKRMPPDFAWLMVRQTPVEPGDQVDAGDVLTVFDDALFAAEVEQAKADHAAAEADLAALGTALNEASSGLQDIESQRSALSTQVAQLQQQRVDILIDLEAARKLIGTPVPTGTPDPAEKVVELEAQLAKVDAGIAEANQALDRLSESGGEVSDVVSALEGAQKAARAIVEMRKIMVEMAETYLERATLRAPVSGMVLTTHPPGTVLAPRSPTVTMRPSSSVTVRTWVTGEQRERITLGASAQIGADYLGEETLSGAVTEIGTSYEYVPTTFATKEIHMIRGFEVTIVVYGDRGLPPGTPVDVTIQTIGNTDS